MRKISFDDLNVWSAERGYRLDDWIPSLGAISERLDFRIPGEPQALTEFLDDLVTLESESMIRLFWARDWTIWNERSQEIGLTHLKLLTTKASHSPGSENGHIYVMAPDEWKEAVSLLVVPALYGWDAHLMFDSGRVLVDVSHEGRVQVAFRKGHSVDTARLSHWLASVEHS